MGSGRCSTLYCLVTPIEGRSICSKCRAREWRQNHPAEDAYRHLKSNAKRRGKPFKLTMPWWKAWCAVTNYLNLRGMGPDDMTVDCDDDYVGYVDDGITMKTRSKNSSEGRKGKPPVYKPDGVPF